MFLAKPTLAPDEPSADPRPRALIIGASLEESGPIVQQITDLAVVVGATADPRDGRALAAQRAADVVFVHLDEQPEAMMEAARQLAQLDGRAVIAVSRDRNPDQIVRAMRAGVRDFAYLEQPGDVRRALASLALVGPEQAPRGVITAIFGAKGGSGATTIAANLARGLVGGDRRTVLVDLDVQMGDALVFLDITGGFGWRDLLRDMARLDDDLLERSLVRHASGLRLLAGTAPIEDAEPLTAAEVQRGLAHLRQHADAIVVDGLRDFSDAAVAALDIADRIILVLTQDVPSLKNASRALAVFRRLGYGPEKVKIVLNRYSRRVNPGLDAIADALGAPIHATIANDFPTVVAALNAGKLLVDHAARAHVTRDILGLAALVAPEGGSS